MPQTWHPFTQHGLGHNIPEVVRAAGTKLYTKDNREIIDAISSWWVQTHGHCNPKITAAIQEQTAKLDQIIFASWTHEPAEQLTAQLGEFLPSGLSHLFYSDSGSTAVEVALKMALGYWHNMGEARSRILVMEHSYHGDTIGAMSIGERGVYNNAYSPLLFDVEKIPFPTGTAECQTIAALEKLCSDAENVPAALIVEPLVSGAGGMMMYPPAILTQMAKICAAHNVLFIVDEVMTGWGRTGTIFACEQAGITPDILCMAKGLTGGMIPLAITAAQKPIFDAHFSQDRSKLFYHSSSFTANPISCAAALANLAIWREEPVQSRIDHIITRHRAFGERISKANNISGIRQCGTIMAFELQDSSGDYLSPLGPRLLAFFAEANVLLRPLGNTIYIMPPYCITDEELDRVYGVIEEAIAAF